jgi:N-methylhydantoinase A
VTDCYVVAGYVDPDNFLGGRLRLDRAAAVAALEAVAELLGMTGEDRVVRVAQAALRITTAVMSSEIARDLAQKGDDARDYALIAFGGAGPTQSVHLAEDAGIATVVIPATPSTFCALGAILADVKRDFVVSRMLNLADGAPALEALAGSYARLQAMAADWVASEGSILGETRFEAVADARYAGQAFDLPIRVSEANRGKPDPAALTELFHQAHEKIYSFRDPDSAVEITTQRLRVIGTMPPITLPRVAAGPGGGAVGARSVYLDGSHSEVPLYRRDSLQHGQTFAGPAIVEQEDTTTVILPGWSARIDAIGNIVISRDGSAV